MKIICIGRNYADHAKELNNPVPAAPVFFMKAGNAILRNNFPFFIPDFSNEIHYETELVIRICKLGKSIQEKFAHKYYNAIGIGIDFTARDLQQNCKEKGLPWEIAKAFDGSAPISEFIPLSDLKDREQIRFHLDINGETVQTGLSSDMIFSFEKIIAYVSRFNTLKTGDLIFTGTPAGVGPVKINDRLEAWLEDTKMLDFRVK
jgi:acylpyruvate hydrolase